MRIKNSFKIGDIVVLDNSADEKYLSQFRPIVREMAMKVSDVEHDLIYLTDLNDNKIQLFPFWGSINFTYAKYFKLK